MLILYLDPSAVSDFVPLCSLLTQFSTNKQTKQLKNAVGTKEQNNSLSSKGIILLKTMNILDLVNDEMDRIFNHL